MKLKKIIVPAGCVVFFALCGLANFLTVIPEKEAAWENYLADKEEERVLAEAEKLRHRWDFRLLSVFPSSRLAREFARLDRLEGQAAYNQRRLGQALAIYQKTKNIADPAILSFFHYNQGVICMKIKKYDLAIEAYERALRFNPRNKEAAFNLELLKKVLRENEDEGGNGKSGLDRFDIEDYEKWSKDKKEQKSQEEEKRW